MLEVCRYTDTDSVYQRDLPNMKHSAPNVEVFEFNLGRAPQLRCEKSEKSTSCSECETCQLAVKLREVKEWLPRLGDHSRKRLMLGLIQRFHSAELLMQIVKLLQPIICKDFTYSRSRTNPSLLTDMTTLSADRALTADKVDEYIWQTWQWFGQCNYWSKANFALVLLQMCDAHLLHAVGTQARTLLISEERAASEMPDVDYMEGGSIASSSYTYHTDEHPELQLLTATGRKYGQDTTNPFTGQDFPGSELDNIFENCDDDDDLSFHDSDFSSLDPAYVVIPTSAKAYAGVAKRCDLIRQLPVHLSKMILSLLDKGSLMSALCVSVCWRTLVEEVHKDFYVNEQLWEEVMLMQGAAAQGANPMYAKDTDVLVPNVHSESSHVIRTNESIVKTTFKSEVSFETAYSGVSIRKVIMEERNVYCGAYNVMVLTGQFDQHRVCDTDGNRLIVIGSKDRKLRFIDTETGHEHKRMTKGESKDDELPIITGHAGSVRCVHIMEKLGVVLSGSYDTSIRMWSIKTGHCLKIFRGHRDTVLCMRVVGELLISGSKDRSCKVWDMQTGKCQRSYRHRYPVLSVAMSADVVISGCEGGKVKVWDLKSGNLIKVLTGHHAAITAIQFDRWHIVTSGRDGYALVWSAFGDHNRCLSALRHPREVLCLEFMYLRCITGCGDGRIRIWNILTGQCCRIMRGNSVSDPILSIIAIGDRITINTAVNLLVLNFEKVTWDYNLPDDKVPPLVQYGHYSDAPVRQQPYPYIRAQRMKKAGASNTKILNKGMEEGNGVGAKPPTSQISIKAAQLPHSAKSLSAKSLSSARFIQTIPESGYETGSLASRELRGMKSASYVGHVDSARKHQSLSAHSKPPLPKSRPQTSKSAASAHSVTIMENVAEHEFEDEWREPLLIKRRISWAFEEPILPKTKGITLSETKALLRSQMRMKSESVVPPDFIYLTVNAIQSSLKPTETSENTEKNLRDARKMLINTRRDRPSSSPSKIDPRTRVPVGELDLSVFRERQEEEAMSEFSDWKSIKTTKSKESEPPLPDKEVYSTKCQVKPLRTCPKVSVHPKRIRTSLPRARVIRPISASVQRREPPEELRHDRPVTAPNMRARPDTASSIPSQIAASLPGAQPGSAKRHVQTTGNTANIVPMLMYPPDMKEKLIEKLKEKRQQRNDDLLESASEMGRGKVSQYNDPMRSHIKFELRTHNQEKDYITHVEKQHSIQRKREEAMMERKRKLLWMAKAKGQNIPRTQSAPVI